mgnify:CR=1 FL=1
MKRNGKTSSGRTRWRCKRCGASTTQEYSDEAKWLRRFVGWLLGKRTQAELDVGARNFRKHTSAFWGIWPILPICDEVHHVVYMDGLWLARECVILIACSDEHVIGCHLAKSENSKDWSYLMRRIAAPDVLVCDGGGGIAKAMRAAWPRTKMQRCAFHAFRQVRRCTTTRPKTQAGCDIYALARDLMRIESNTEAAIWMARFQKWCADHEDFLKERNDTGRYVHERLRKARRSLIKLCNAGTLFTYLAEDLAKDGPIPSTSNRIENLNGQIRRMLSLHRGMNIDHRIKAVFWFCYMKSDAPMPFARMLHDFPTDDDIGEWRRRAARANGGDSGTPARWGDGIMWSELHHSIPYPYKTD